MKKFGLIGKTLGHSFSKDFFATYFADNNIEATYDNIELSSIEQFIQHKDEYSGFNVTIPYKEAIIPFLDECSEQAKEIGAVNVICNRNGRLIGHNTDAFGFQQSIKPFLTSKHERAMILGTGGASSAVAYVLKGLGIDVIYISRIPSAENEFGYDAVNEHMIRACKLIVNTTPVGMSPNDDALITLPYESLSDEHLLVDLIYNPTKTRFLQEGERFGAAILNGHSMLKEQALKSYKIWTDHV